MLLSSPISLHTFKETLLKCNVSNPDTAQLNWLDREPAMFPV